MTFLRRFLISSALTALFAFSGLSGHAQTAAPGAGATPPAAAADQTPAPLSDQEMEILVARIALYPDELVALISAASLYPLQIVEADRFLNQLKTDKNLKPKSEWDGSVISLLNYPDVVRMMSEDLTWTQALGSAIVNQQDDVLAAIQQLREKAVANNVIKSDEKVKVTQDNGNVVIQPASKEVIYIPQYPPEMLYEDNYPYEPISYYPESYPYYYNPGAAFFAGAVTGAFWAAVIDWDDGFWGGDWNWGDGGDFNFDFDCNKCIIGSDFNGKLNLRDADWSKIDRSKINVDKAAFSKLDRSAFKKNIESSDRNRIKNKAGELGGNRASTLPSKGNRPVKDVRASTLEGLKKQPGPKPGAGNKMAKPGQGAAGNRPSPGNKAGPKPGGGAKPGTANRPSGPKKPGAKVDNRPKNPSPLGDMTRGSSAQKYSQRGHQSMGGGYQRPSYGGSGGQSFHKRPIPPAGGRGGRGGGRRR